MSRQIQSVQKAIRILKLFSLERPALGISQIGRALNIHKGTAQGIVQTLAKEGFLRQDIPTRKYQLGLDLYELGTILVGSLEINQKASEPTHQLAKRTERLVRVAIPDKDSALVTMDAYPRSQPFISRHFGPRAPLYCTALGKALLAYMKSSELEAYLERTPLIPYTSHTITKKHDLTVELEETRRRGFSINREEHLLSRSAIGAPILGRTGAVEASLALIVSPKEFNAKAIERFAAEVKDTAKEISRYMGYFQEVASKGALGKSH
jgi:DNA-binding IclR family transcriptional regulator